MLLSMLLLCQATGTRNSANSPVTEIFSGSEQPKVTLLKHWESWSIKQNQKQASILQYNYCNCLLLFMLEIV